MKHSDLTIRIINFIVNLYQDSDMLPDAYVDSYTDKLTSSNEETVYRLFHKIVDQLNNKEIYPTHRFMNREVGWSDRNDKAYLMYINLASQLTDQLFDDLILVPR